MVNYSKALCEYIQKLKLRKNIFSFNNQKESSNKKMQILEKEFKEMNEFIKNAEKQLSENKKYKHNENLKNNIKKQEKFTLISKENIKKIKHQIRTFFRFVIENKIADAEKIRKQYADIISYNTKNIYDIFCLCVRAGKVEATRYLLNHFQYITIISNEKNNLGNKIEKQPLKEAILLADTKNTQQKKVALEIIEMLIKKECGTQFVGWSYKDFISDEVTISPLGLACTLTEPDELIKLLKKYGLATLSDVISYRKSKLFVRITKQSKLIKTSRNEKLIWPAIYQVISSLNLDALKALKNNNLIVLKNFKLNAIDAKLKNRKLSIPQFIAEKCPNKIDVDFLEAVISFFKYFLDEDICSPECWGSVVKHLIDKKQEKILSSILKHENFPENIRLTISLYKVPRPTKKRYLKKQKALFPILQDTYDPFSATALIFSMVTGNKVSQEETKKIENIIALIQDYTLKNCKDTSVLQKQYEKSIEHLIKMQKNIINKGINNKPSDFIIFRTFQRINHFLLTAQSAIMEHKKTEEMLPYIETIQRKIDQISIKRKKHTYKNNNQGCFELQFYYCVLTMYYADCNDLEAYYKAVKGKCDSLKIILTNHQAAYQLLIKQEITALSTQNEQYFHHQKNAPKNNNMPINCQQQLPEIYYWLLSESEKPSTHCSSDSKKESKKKQKKNFNRSGRNRRR